MVTSIAGDQLTDALAPALRESYGLHLERELREALILESFENCIAENHVERNRFFGLFVRGANVARLNSPLSGKVVDLHAGRLRELVRLLRDALPNAKIVLSAGVGDRVDGQLEIWIYEETDDVALGRRTPLALSEEEQQRAKVLLAGLYRVSHRRPSELVDVLRRFNDTLPHIARHEAVDHLQRSLEVLVAVIVQRLKQPELERLDVMKGEQWASLPSHLNLRRWHETAAAVAEAQDAAKIETFMRYGGMLMYEASRNGQSRALRAFGQVLDNLYGSTSATLTEITSIGRRIGAHRLCRLSRPRANDR